LIYNILYCPFRAQIDLLQSPQGFVPSGRHLGLAYIGLSARKPGA